MDKTGASPVIGPPSTARPDPRFRTWVFIAAFYGLAVMSGLRGVYHSQRFLFDLMLPLALAITLGCWAVVDSKRRGRPIPLLARQWFVLLAGVVVPGYVIWSRRWRGVGLVILHVLGWYLLFVIAMHAGGTLVFGREWWRAME